MNRLGRFVDDARQRVHLGLYDVEGTPPLPSNGSLRDAVLGRPDAVVAELKPRSPSEGRLLDRPAEDLLADYLEGGAAALSVLTDADHFDGSPELLRLAHATGLPTMMKDFVVDERQLDCAAHHGASAVLLIERCLDPARREALVTAAHERGLEVLLEVFTAADWETARNSAADVIGVNARDLDTLELDPEGSLRLVAAIHAAGRPVLALSGVRSRADRLRATAAGADGVLVGTHLAKSPDACLWLKALRRPLAKVCGLTREADVDAAAEAGADLAGFVVGGDSPRAIGALAAQRLAHHARGLGLRTVLVTAHDDEWEVREWCRVAKPDFVQLHRSRPEPEWVHSLGSIPTRVLLAVGPDEAEAELPGVGLVLDTPSRHGTGGSGETHDWAASARHVAAAPQRFSLVAGGLAADNVAEAVRATGAWGADASSRLESAPGLKDAEAVRAYVEAVHAA